MHFTKDECVKIMTEASEAAQKAAQVWLDVARSKGPAYMVGQANLITGELESIEGTMLDLCGGAYLKFKDRRSSTYKSFVRADADERWIYRESGIIYVAYALRGRQEQGLHVRAIKAAMEVFTKHGFGHELSFHHYLD